MLQYVLSSYENLEQINSNGQSNSDINGAIDQDEINISAKTLIARLQNPLLRKVKL